MIIYFSLFFLLHIDTYFNSHVCALYTCAWIGKDLRNRTNHAIQAGPENQGLMVQLFYGRIGYIG